MNATIARNVAAALEVEADTAPRSYAATLRAKAATLRSDADAFDRYAAERS